MPGLDRNGPQGLGPVTGRGLGACGRGMRRGFNWLGRGTRRGWGLVSHPLSKEDEKASLDQEEKILSDELAQVRKEREALGSQK